MEYLERLAAIIRFGPLTADTGSPWVNIVAVIMIVLALTLGFKLIRRYGPRDKNSN